MDPEESAPEVPREPERKSMFDKREYAAAEEVQEEQDDIQTYDYRPNPDPYEPDLYDPEPERQREEIIERSEPEVDPERLRLEQEEQERNAVIGKSSSVSGRDSSNWTAAFVSGRRIIKARTMSETMKRPATW